LNIEAALKEAMTIDGALGALLVDWESGMSLGGVGGGKYLDLDVAAAGNTEVIRAKTGEAVAALRAAGAQPADVGQGDVAWTVLADPEGNEFCVLTPR
jgi:hypothetical protein